MPKKKTPDESPKDQFRRFVETAKEREVDKAKAERAFRNVTKKPKPASS